MARQFGVAEPTIGSRLRGMAERGVMRVTVQRDLTALGYPVFAFLDVYSDGRPPGEIAADLTAIEERRLTKTRRKAKSIPELISDKCKGRENIEAVVSTLVNRYQSRIFLPHLRDVARFFDRSDVKHARLKSRIAALPKVIEILSQLSVDQLDALSRDAVPKEQTDFSLLAREIMGGQKPK